MMKATRFIAAAMCAFGLTAVDVPDVNAQFGIKVGGGGVRVKIPGASKRLNEARSLVRKGQKARPKRMTDVPAKVQAAIDSSEAIVATIDQKIKGLSMVNGYKDVKRKRDLLVNDIAQDKILAVCGVAWREVNAFHRQGKLAPNAALKKLDAAVASFTKQAPRGYEDTVRWWTREAKRMRADNPRIAKQAKERADREAGRAKQEAERKEQRRKATAFKGVNVIISNMYKAAKAYAGPIPESTFADLDNSIAEVEKVHAPAVHYFKQHKRWFQYYNALTGEAGAPSKVLGGETVAKGEVIGKKKLTVTFKAQPNWCYLVLPAWKMWTENERINNIRLTAKKGAGQVQRFWMFDHGPWMDAEGLCARKKLTVSYTADLAFAGTRNGIKYTVVGWPKAIVPMFVASRIGLRRYDSCDPTEWESLWRDPVPGTVVWAGQEPYLVQYPKRPGRSGNYWGINTSGSSLSRAELLLHKPKTRVSKQTFRAPRCAADRAHSKMAKSITRCVARTDAKYEKMGDRLARQKKYARSIGSYRAAQRGLDNLDDKYGKEYAATCGKKIKKLNTIWQALFNTMVDWVTDDGPEDSLNVAAEWLKWKEAYTGRHF